MDRNVKIAKELIKLAKSLFATEYSYAKDNYDYMTDKQIAEQFDEWWINEIQIDEKHRNQCYWDNRYDIEVSIQFPSADGEQFDNSRGLWYVMHWDDDDQDKPDLNDEDSIASFIGDVNDVYLGVEEDNVKHEVARAFMKMNKEGKTHIEFNSAQEYGRYVNTDRF